MNRVYLSPPHVGAEERRLLLEAFESNWIAPVGPHIETELDVSDIRVTTTVNGVIKQDGRTSQMVFPVDFLIRYISRQMTLKTGDLIATGTPSGVSKLNPGDVCEITVEGIGTLSNKVVNDNDSFDSEES